MLDNASYGSTGGSRSVPPTYFVVLSTKKVSEVVSASVVNPTLVG